MKPLILTLCQGDVCVKTSLPRYNYIFVNNALVKEVLGRPARDFSHKPWKARVVRIRRHEASGMRRCIYRLVYGSSGLGVEMGQYWLSPKSRAQLGLGSEDKVAVDVPFQPWGRFCYYNNHLDDTTRFTFRLGIWALALGVLPLLQITLDLVKRILAYMCH
jgi:hypothetical protein